MRRLVAFAILLVVIVGGFQYLRGGTPDFVQRVQYPLHYEDIIRGHARNYQLEPALLAAVIYQESKFDPHVRSSSGAVGLMQLLRRRRRGSRRTPAARSSGRATSTTPRSTFATARGTSGT